MDLKARIIGKYEYHSSTKMRVFGSFIAALSVIPAISHFFFFNAPDDVPFLDHKNIYNFVVGFSNQITWLMLVFAVWCRAYFIGTLFPLFLIIFNLVEVFSYNLNENLIWNLCIAVVCFTLILLLRKGIFEAKLFESESEEKLMEIESFMKKIKERNGEYVSRSELKDFLNKNGISLKDDE
ncbi:hypothetical protein [Tenacibaculum agarivorans]|uniref:hypothetical protein n=1 Tax=Tenacibaculum agarivorans TaxID=1908389 RepID=UPI00094BA024|nr:hypothetical protein [Tenacibaculum agarivorans]